MHELLKKVSLFSGLTQSDIEHIQEIAATIQITESEMVITQNTMGEEMYIIADGAVEVFVQGMANERTIVMLGEGQNFGEMALIDQGYRSASVRATKDGCKLYVIKREDFNQLCQSNYRIGFYVMRNLAVDLAFKMRHRNLTAM